MRLKHDRAVQRARPHRRFLSRIFSERDDSDWLLKGGTGVLARVASGRRTTDIDLFRANNTLDGALAELIRLASIDLDDFFRFVYTRHRSVVGGDRQTYTEGYGVDFDVYIGVDKKEPLHVDLVVGVIVTDEVTVTPPANRLDLPRLRSNDYLLYPTVDQIADKVCATMADYSGRPSSREKDLADEESFRDFPGLRTYSLRCGPGLAASSSVSARSTARRR